MCSVGLGIISVGHDPLRVMFASLEAGVAYPAVFQKKYTYTHTHPSLSHMLLVSCPRAPREPYGAFALEFGSVSVCVEEGWVPTAAAP